MRSKKVFFYFCLYTILVLPSSLQFGDLIYKNGVYWFDILSIVMIIFCMLQYFFGQRVKVNKNIFYLFLPILVIILYSFFYFITTDMSLEGLKDFRPLLYLLFVILFSILRGDITIDDYDLERFIFISFLLVVFWSIILVADIFNTDDLFYKSTFRYLGIQTYFCLFYLLYAFSNNKISIKTMLLAYIVLFISSSRMLLLVSLIPFLMWWCVNNFTYKKIFTLFIIVCLMLFVLYNTVIFERFEDLYNQGFLSFFANRFSPVFDKTESMTSYNYIFGFGFGELFYIPWFKNRVNINNYSVQIDSGYLNFYIKYGLFSIVFFIGCLGFFFQKLNRHFICISLIFLMLLVTSSLYYHMASLGFYIFYILTLNRRTYE